MKKIFTVLVLCILLTGCGEKEKSITCTRSTNQTNLSLDVTYNVTYKGKYVTKESRKEVLKTSDESIIKAYKAQLENIFESYKNIKYYETNIDVKGDTLTATTDINYKKINMKKLMEADGSITTDKILLSDLKSTYGQLGFDCSK